MREELGLRGGEAIEVTIRDGRIELEPSLKHVQLVERDGFLAAEIEEDESSPLTASDVRDLLERFRR
jgi:bifunctional DNA-binding transcriptional regulator/antitoxin component of YhaV-PrlF toxin-antitoxin module